MDIFRTFEEFWDSLGLQENSGNEFGVGADVNGNAIGGTRSEAVPSLLAVLGGRAEQLQGNTTQEQDRNSANSAASSVRESLVQLWHDTNKSVNRSLESLTGSTFGLGFFPHCGRFWIISG